MTEVALRIESDRLNYIISVSYVLNFQPSFLLPADFQDAGLLNFLRENILVFKF